MTAETAQKFRALEDQANKLRDIFTGAGYEPVAPAILQPADIFLDQVGEALRARTYVFSGLDGEELCLRPDLTVPTCRLYLERHPSADTVAKYSYNGPAFRFQPQTEDNAQPREFRQAGIENIGSSNKGKAETEVLSLISQSVKECGLSNYIIKFGDLALFKALIHSLDIPDRWSRRLMQHFWNPDAFLEQLNMLTVKGSGRDACINTILAKLTAAEPEKAPELVKEYLDSKDIPFFGNRKISEITERLQGQLADLKANPLSEEKVKFIENYLSICARPKAAGARIADLAHAAGINLDTQLQNYTKRLDLFAEAGIDLSNAVFAAEFGRELEYYSGFVFQLEVPDLKGKAGQIAGGGRYDSLIGDIDGGRHTPAVGSAIHTERLLEAAEGMGHE